MKGVLVGTAPLVLRKLTYKDVLEKIPANGSITVSELAKILNSDRYAIGAFLQHLKKRGLAENPGRGLWVRLETNKQVETS